MTAKPILRRVPTRMADFLRATRKARALLLPAGFDAEPAWDLLLCLFVADAEERSLCTADLIEATGTPGPTVFRWLRSFENHEFVERRPDPVDRRRIDIILTAVGRQRITDCLEEIGRLREMPVISPREVEAITDLAGRLNEALIAILPRDRTAVSNSPSSPARDYFTPLGLAADRTSAVP